MNTTDSFWEETSNMHPVKYESCNSNDEQHDRLMKEEPGIHFRYCDGNLNFATAACSEDDSEYGPYHKKNKVSRQDPMSHRIIEKRRRDRMNNCLADLSRLIPADYLKKGRGRIEKTEIIEMAIKHMKYLQQMYNTDRKAVNTEHYRLGFQECMSETMSFLVEVEGFFAREALCVKLLNHLQAHCETLLSSDRFHSGSSVGPPAPNSVAGHSQTSNSTSVRQPSASNGIPDHIDSNSQLRDMLNGGIIKETASEPTSNVPLPIVNECSNSCEPIALTNPSPPNDPQIVNPHNAEKSQLSPASNYLRLKPTQERESYEYLRPNTDHMLQIQHRPGPNNNLYHHTESNNYENVRQLSENELYDKNRECTNGASLYKFKNNINQRFIQDLNAENGSYQTLNKLYKRRKTNNNSARRTSSTMENYCYSENHSSSPTDNSQASFPCSEVYTRGGSSESDNTNRISPTGSSVSDNKQISRHSPKSFENYPKHLMHISRSSHEIMKTNGNNAHYGRYSPNMKHSTKTTGDRHCQNNNTEKPNFGIPIFVLHTKGSFYIPLTIDYNTLIPYLQNYDILDMLPNVHNIILHPVTINVNFQPNIVANICKQPKYKVEVENGWH